MKFVEFFKRDTGSKGVVAPPKVLAKLERELKSGATLSVLLEQQTSSFAGLPVEHLREIVDSFRRWECWRPRATKVGRRLESIEREVISRTTRVHQLAVIERALRLMEQNRVEALDRPGVLSTALELWNSCCSEVRQRGSISIRLVREDHPLADQYGDYVKRTEDLSELKAYRWLAMRRGERDGVLNLSLNLDAVPLVLQVSVRRERFGGAVRDRTDESLMQELVLDDLKIALFEDLDEWARLESLRVACEAYAGLLRGRQLRCDRIGGVFLGTPQSPVGAVILDGEGTILDYLDVDPQERGWMAKVVKFLELSQVLNIAVPSDTRSSKRLSGLEEKLGKTVNLIAVRPAALAEARKILDAKDRKLPKSAASAAILARRVLDPMKAWGHIDPIRTGVGEYQNELDETDLREALIATRALVKKESKKKGAPGAPPVAKKTAPLGPTVRTVAELRPGMTVSGQVTNITGFGAFVSLGLEYEGMVHVSELSDEFISNPNEVVKIGDKVTARVIAVDPRRRRISLSLRSEAPRDRGDSRTSRRGSGGPQRSQALRDLEKLFKS